MSNIETVKRMNAACRDKDFDTAASLLHPDYTFKDPAMSFYNPKDFLEFMKSCPMDGDFKNVEMVESGDKVIQTLDCVMTKPLSFEFRMCDILTLKDGKIIAEEAFYDTAQIPEEAKRIAEKNKQKNAA